VGVATVLEGRRVPTLVRNLTLKAREGVKQSTVSTLLANDMVLAVPWAERRGEECRKLHGIEKAIDIYSKGSSRSIKEHGVYRLEGTSLKPTIP
jgi:hypothetical protein